MTGLTTRGGPHAGRSRRENGAAAVEMAVVLPVLMFILLGIIEFGFVFNTQIALTQAAREGVRYEALGTGTAEDEAVNAYTALGNDQPTANLVDDCDSGDQARLILTIDHGLLFFRFLFPGGDDSITLRGEAVMRCGG
jgi:Flp pilus assembly protein TadG